MHLYRVFIQLVLTVSVSIVLVACGDDDGGTDPTADLQPISVADDGDVEVEFFTEGDGLAVGRNVVYYKVTMAGDDTMVTNATVTQSPVMQMMDFSHACPETDPGPAGEDGLYQGKIIFIMPSSDMGTWSNTATVVLDGEATEHAIAFEDLTITGNDRRQTLQWQEGEDDITGFFMLNPDAPWAVGSNSYIMTAHYRQDMMNFPELDDLTIDVSLVLGDGSPEAAESPTYDQDGEHLGSLELSEAGTWTVSATITQGSTELGAVAWTVEVE